MSSLVIEAKVIADTQRTLLSPFRKNDPARQGHIMEMRQSHIPLYIHYIITSRNEPLDPITLIDGTQDNLVQRKAKFDNDQNLGSW